MKIRVRVHYACTSVVTLLTPDEFLTLIDALDENRSFIQVPGEQEGTYTILNPRNYTYITTKEEE